MQAALNEGARAGDRFALLRDVMRQTSCIDFTTQLRALPRFKPVTCRRRHDFGDIRYLGERDGIQTVGRAARQVRAMAVRDMALWRGNE